MKVLFVSSVLFLGFTYAAVAADPLSLVPKRELQGIKILGCEKKPATYTVSCRATGCTVNVVAEKYTCKGVRE